MRNGLPEPELQSKILDDHGRFIGYGDLAYPEFKVLVEYDGQQHRTDAVQYHEDGIRHDELLAAGWKHIRVDKESPRFGQLSAPVRARQALHARGWRP